MKNEALVSVAMTTYNGQKFIRKQLDSILMQDYPNLEIIVCDDVSQDETYSILEQYQEFDKRIKIFKNEENLGYKKNFEKAISLCSGEYIALADQDDIWTSNHISHLLCIIGTADLACGNQRIMDEYDTITDDYVHVKRDYSCYYNNYMGLYRILFNGGFLQGASMLLKKTFLNRTGILPIPDSIPDHDAWFTLCAYLFNGVNFSFDVITYFRRHENNASIHETCKKRTPLSILEDIFTTFDFKTNKDVYIAEIEKSFTFDENREQIIKQAKIYIDGMRSKYIGKRLKAIYLYFKYFKYINFLIYNRHRFISTIIRLY